MPSRCATWARVSKGEQESGNQLAQLSADAARRGLEVAAEFVLDGLSALTGAHREQLRQVLYGARRGEIDVLLAGRSTGWSAADRAHPRRESRPPRGAAH